MQFYQRTFKLNFLWGYCMHYIKKSITGSHTSELHPFILHIANSDVLRPSQESLATLDWMPSITGHTL